MDFVGNVQLVAGDSGAVDEILKLLQKNGIKTTANPDLYVREYASFGIDEARDIAQKASMRAVLSPRRAFVIVTPGMTTDAQNALLKTLEEPAGGALFFIVIPSTQTVLPTLRSRAQILELASAGNRTSALNVQQFLQAGGQKRLDMLKPLFEKDEDDKRDLAGSIEFLAELERTLAKDPEQNSGGLEAIYRARKYIGDKGSLQKALLEQVALLV